MPSPDAMRLRRLAAELRAEVLRIGRVTDEIHAALDILRSPDCGSLSVYGAAALLETFYTGVEKALTRIAMATGGVPEGAAWHRDLLQDMTLDLPTIRPPVLSEATARALEPYLAFRHRFRNLYLFDLEPELLIPLLERVAGAWQATTTELAAFAERVEELADEIEQTR